MTLLATLSLSLLLTGCDIFPKRIDTEYVYLPVEITDVADPRPVRLNRIKFDVVSEKNLEKFLEENAKRNGTIVFIAMDVGEYEAMSTNLAELERYIDQQIKINAYYKKSIAETKETADELNDLRKAQ